jgi:hypothetical protein
MKYTLYRKIESYKLIAFFRGTQAQCLWKLLRHTVNLTTVLVDSIPAVTWINLLPIKKHTFKTSVSGHTISFGGAGTKNISAAFSRAERKFATTF